MLIFTLTLQLERDDFSVGDAPQATCPVRNMLEQSFFPKDPFLDNRFKDEGVSMCVLLFPTKIRVTLFFD